MKLGICSLPISDVKLVFAARVSDRRGYFAETYVRRDFVAAGIACYFVQDNQSGSIAAGTIRDLHFQIPPFAQTKLIRVVRGRILDVAVDLRHSSQSYGQHVAVELSEAEDKQLLVPAGFAHGFCTLETNTVVCYKVDNLYSADHDRGVSWADPDLKIPRPVTSRPVVMSNKDRALPCLRDLPA